MAADTLPATLGFLTDAAHLLVSATPETSAHLMTRRNSLMFEHDLSQSDVQRQHICSCCGHIMIAGHGDQLKIDSVKSCHRKRPTGHKQKKARVQSSVNTGCRKTWTCGMCGRYTTISLPPPARVPKRRSKQTLRPSTTKIAGVNETTTSSSSSLSTIATKTTTLAPKVGVGHTLVTTSSSEATKVSANASSKKRAKNRKQGLQALLQQSSSSKPQSGLGLSLADFMQN